MAKDFETRSDISLDTRSDVSSNSKSDFGGDLAKDEGVNLNRSTDNTEKDNVDDLMGASSMCNADEMQEELDLNQERYNYYGNENEIHEAEQFFMEHPELRPESVTWNEPSDAQRPDYFQNPDSDTAIFGGYPEYIEAGQEGGHAHFNSDSYDADRREALLNGEDPYVATGNSDFVETVGSEEKELIFTDDPYSGNLGAGSQREFDQIQEATGITPNDIYQDEDGHHHIDTGGTWISPEDRNAEYNDAYEDDKETGNYVDGYDNGD